VSSTAVQPYGKDEHAL